jgi:dienelactone hydrolase
LNHADSLLEAFRKEKPSFALAISRWFTETDCMRILGLMALTAMLAGGAMAAEKKAEKITLSGADRETLESGAADLERAIEQLRSMSDPHLRSLLPDVEIYWKAVDWAVRYNEIYRTNEIGMAKNLLRQGMDRAKALRNGNPPWLTATGLVVRGYVSKIDGSVQPYGLVVPPTFQPGSNHKHRLDVWLHGRDDSLTELKFISDRQRSLGEFTPADTIVLHAYGRLCNAFKFAGETDVFEAIAHAKEQYPIDEERVAIRGFSMGGAGTWHLAAHHAGFWTAAAPGAGFAETAIYTKALEKEPGPPWYEKQLWHLYDATDYAANLFNCSLIAYSGELDPQKQAADMMATAMGAEGLKLRHLIGPGVQHKYEPETKKELAKQFDELMAKGKGAVPRKIRLTTFTLRYNRQKWITVDEMEKHWTRARVEAELEGDVIEARTENVTGLSIELPATTFQAEKTIRVKLDGQEFALGTSKTGTWKAQFVRDGAKWKQGTNPKLHKAHGLQGPIDDAFMDSFIFVRPTGQPLSAESGKWVEAEMSRATNGWRAQFRGYAPMKRDTEITESDIRQNHLILWGDPKSNKVLGRLAKGLPVKWSGGEFSLAGRTYSNNEVAPVLIFPNPLNPKKYVVLNSGFTFSEFAKASNAQQTPKLPDYALVEMKVPAAERLAQGIKEAGFFNEAWELR